MTETLVTIESLIKEIEKDQRHMMDALKWTDTKMFRLMDQIEKAVEYIIINSNKEGLTLNRKETEKLLLLLTYPT
jgi:hypothetical protein